MLVYLSNVFERMEMGLTQSILEVVVNHMPPGGQLAYCTLLEPNKPPSATTLKNSLTLMVSLLSSRRGIE